jgi:hypothetical protein
MQTANPWNAATIRPEGYAAFLGKLLAVAIILAPLVAMLFPELNHRSGNTPLSGTPDAPTVRSLVSDPMPNPVAFKKSDRRALDE